MPTTKPTATRPHMPGYGVPAAKKGMLPFSYFEKVFGENRNYFIATVKTDGTPHVMPLWGVWSGGLFYFSTGDGSRKARNLSANPSCTIATEDGTQPAILEGTAKVVKSGAGLAKAAVAYKKKYDWALDPALGAIRAVTPRKAFAFKEAAEVFGPTATRWMFK